MLTQEEWGELRREFPQPLSVTSNLRDDTYCVGGALMRYRQHALGFPDASQLATSLMDEDRGLEWQKAEHIARYVLGLNDEGNFDAAWEELHRAVVRGVVE